MELPAGPYMVTKLDENASVHGQLLRCSGGRIRWTPGDGHLNGRQRSVLEALEVERIGAESAHTVEYLALTAGMQVAAALGSLFSCLF